MGTRGIDGPGGSFLFEPRTLRADVLRHAVAMVVVLSVAGGVVVHFGRAATNDEASEVDRAVLIDLPAAEASSAPSSDSAEGPEQQAAAASAAQPAPPTPVMPPDRPPTPPEREPSSEQGAEVAPPPVAPDPAAVLERKRDEARQPPEPVDAPAALAQDERAPTGAPDPARTDATEGDEGRPHASRHAITLWQRSLLQRLERAKRLSGPTLHDTGTVTIAFTVDSAGALASAQVAHGSGSASLDRAALSIVRMAAPFPAPPARSDSRDASFLLPIHFR